ncbi:MAG: universal stress protein [Nocardioides sp.]
MTTTAPDTTTEPFEGGSVVVGVDGSPGSDAAVGWAAAEAAATGRSLRLVTATTHHRDRARSRLRRAVARISPTIPRLPVGTAVHDGRAGDELLAHLGDAAMLVVGKRGRGAIPRLLVGSTAIAVAGRSPVPVVVVPTEWDGDAHRHQPVVVGVDPDNAHHHLMHLAFRRARRLRVGVVAVHGTEGPQQLDDEEDDGEHRVAALLDPAESSAHDRFQAALTWWSGRFREVEVRAVRTAVHPAMALIAESEQGAQLVVLGRRVRDRDGGFGFGSVTRAVLHYAEVPVMVVPDEAADLSGDQP